MEQDYNVRAVPSALVGQMWRYAEPYVKRALDHTFGEISVEHLRQSCMDRDTGLWLITKNDLVKGAAVTQITVYPNMKVCRIITLAGSEFEQWRAFALNVLGMYAIHEGCEGVEAYVRKGFVPKLVELGFKHKYSVCHLSLKD